MFCSERERIGKNEVIVLQVREEESVRRERTVVGERGMVRNKKIMIQFGIVNSKKFMHFTWSLVDLLEEKNEI